MRKTIQTFIATIILLALTACTKVEETNSAISDFLTSPTDNEEVGSDDDKIAMIFKELESYSRGGYALTLNDNNGTICYDGEPVKVLYDIKMSESNETNWSIGVAVFINGLMQDISADEENYDNMAVFADLEPGKSYKKEIWFKPSILQEDKGKDKLDVIFAECTNVHYRPKADCPRLNGTHGYPGRCFVLEMQVNKEITNIVEADIETNVRDEIQENPERGVSHIMPNKDESYDIYYLNEDGTLSGTYVLQNTDSGNHRLAFFLNDEPITFNGGKRFVDVEFKEGHNYFFDFVLDEKPKAFDYFYVLDIYDVRRNKNSARLGSDLPSIIVEHDYVDPLS